MVANLKFSAEQASCDPSDSAVIVVGQVRNLLKVKFDHIKCKLAPRVTEQVSTKHCRLRYRRSDATVAVAVATVAISACSLGGASFAKPQRTTAE